MIIKSGEKYLGYLHCICLIGENFNMPLFAGSLASSRCATHKSNSLPYLPRSHGLVSPAVCRTQCRNLSFRMFNEVIALIDLVRYDICPRSVHTLTSRCISGRRYDLYSSVKRGRERGFSVGGCSYASIKHSH